MFKKSQRLSRSEFTHFFKVGQRKHFPHCTIINHPYTDFKVAVVVSKKVAKSAVKRNLYKRRVYALLRKCYEAQAYSGVLIVILKPSFSSLSRKKAEELLISYLDFYQNKS